MELDECICAAGVVLALLEELICTAGSALFWIELDVEVICATLLCMISWFLVEEADRFVLPVLLSENVLDVESICASDVLICVVPFGKISLVYVDDEGICATLVRGWEIACLVELEDVEEEE